MDINKPIVARVAPFIFYIAIMVLSGLLAGMDMDVRWIYAVRAGGTALLLIVLRKQYIELAWPPMPTLGNFFLSILMGLLVFLLWINLDWSWMIIGQASGFDPRAMDGSLNYGMVTFRLAGAVLVVPIMEELFWR